MDKFPYIRLRRLRKNERMRNMLGTRVPGPEKFLWPVFIVEGQSKRVPIEAMPGQHRLSVDRLCAELGPLAASGVGGVLIFGVVDDTRKDAEGTYAWRGNGLVQEAVREVKKHLPDFLVFTDVCLCGYTDHGHCGPLTDEGSVDNDAANEILGKIAVSHGCAGADGVAPSAMMDGQVKAIREALSANRMEDTIVMSYSTKFASAMYGPFREAAGSGPAHGDRRQYQAPFNDIRQALRESKMDEDEGADILMVKPALFYLDVIAKIRETTDLPLAAYNVSGEYSMLVASADHGWGDLRAMVRESVTAIARAGADIIISYWANRYDEIFGKQSASPEVITNCNSGESQLL